MPQPRTERESHPLPPAHSILMLDAVVNPVAMAVLLLCTVNPTPCQLHDGAHRAGHLLAVNNPSTSSTTLRTLTFPLTESRCMPLSGAPKGVACPGGPCVDQQTSCYFLRVCRITRWIKGKLLLLKGL